MKNSRTRISYFRLILMLLLVCGLIYAFGSLIANKIHLRKSSAYFDTVSGSILKAVEETERMQCDSTVHLDVEDKEKNQDKAYTDPTKDLTVIHDFKHKILQVGKGEHQQIFEYGQENNALYSKGISPVYDKNSFQLKNIPTDRWYRYECGERYGRHWKSGSADRLSYGLLKDSKKLLKIEKQATETIEKEEYIKYKVVLRNTLRDFEEGEESEFEFRRILSASGIRAVKLKELYPKVYTMLRDTFRRDTEALYVWVDSNGKLAKIEKDYTFRYYLEIMNDDVERIEEKVGQYGYPRVICTQKYTYAPNCRIIEIPKNFEEW